MDAVLSAEEAWTLDPDELRPYPRAVAGRGRTTFGCASFI
jgi:hypothetical protein